MATQTKIFTAADLNTLGANANGVLDMDELPAGSFPVAVYYRREGGDFTSSGGTVTGLSATLRKSGGTTAIAGNVSGLHTSGRRAQSALANQNANTPEQLDGFGAWTPAILFSVAGSGVNLGNLTGGGDGVEVVLVYATLTP